MLATLHAVEQPTMRLYMILCVVLTSGFHAPQNTARRRTRLRAETELSPYEVLGVRTSAKPDEIRKALRISSGLADVRTPKTS